MFSANLTIVELDSEVSLTAEALKLIKRSEEGAERCVNFGKQLLF